MAARCDAKSDCHDKSDEMSCETLSRNKENFGTYDKTLTPLSDFSDFLKINVSVDVKEIVKIGKSNKSLIDLPMYILINAFS